MGTNPFSTKDGPEMFDNVELGRLSKGVTKQLKSEIKEADTENCKMLPTGAVGMHWLCSLKAVLSRKRVRNSRPAVQECGVLMSGGLRVLTLLEQSE